MKRTIIGFICLLVIVSCNPGLPEKQFQKLENMKTKAQNIKNNLKNKSGTEYLTAHDNYYTLMTQRIKTAIQYLEKCDLEKKTREDLENILNIAKIVYDGEQIIQIVKALFQQFPETRNEKELIQTYFTYAFLLEPQEIEQYVDINIFPPEDQLYCYYMLALGFSESGYIQQAKIYFEKSNRLLTTIISDTQTEHKLPLLYIAGLRSFIAYKIGDKQESYRIIRDAETEFTKDAERKVLRLYENRLNLLGRNAPGLESEHWIGTKKSLNLADLKGKVILLNFFSWDCETCNTNIPILLHLQEQINNDDFMIIGVTKYIGSYEHDVTIPEEREYEYMKNHYYEKRNINWPISISKTVMYNYGVHSTPLYVLIDRDGIVRDGYFISYFAYLEKKIRLLLAE